jgi:hypothetical protein
MKKEKSLCESCSNRVVIKFHGKNIRKATSEGDCFYNFTIMASDNRYEYPANGATPTETHVAHVVVDECSFYNKSFILHKKKKDDSDYDDDSPRRNDDKSNGVTFTNIPGALLP